MIIPLSFALLVLCCFTRVNGAIPTSEDSGDAIHLIVNGEADQYKLKLSKPVDTVLHPDIKYFTFNDDGVHANGSTQISVKTWTPTESERRSAENVYIDPENLAAVRLRWDQSEEKHVADSGVVNGNQIDNGRVQTLGQVGNRTDYIDIGRNITTSTGIHAANEPIIVETLIVCDKDFGDIFNHDRVQILDYLTVYFWDTNLRYKTLPNVQISFRITGVIVIGSTSGQPFIEDARASDGRAEHGRILSRFKSWVYANMFSLPKFDIALVMTSTQLEWGGGVAHVSGACGLDHSAGINWGTAIWDDGGDWRSLAIAAHSIAHILGARDDDDPNFPGGCDARGYIMSGANTDLRWFFSSCSDRLIGNFVKSDQANCLRRLDASQSPPISPDFSFILAPTMDEQCRRRLRMPTAFVEVHDTGNCQSMRCVVPKEGYFSIHWFPPAENTPCLGGGRCFRGRCRKTGHLIKNVASGQCAIPSNPFAFMAWVNLAPCSTPVSGATPLEKFTIEDSPISTAKLLKTPWSAVDGSENGDKCVWTGNGEIGRPTTDRCSTDPNNQNPWHQWDFINLPTGDSFLLQHRITKKCWKQEGNGIITHPVCDLNDRSLMWQLVN